MHRPSQKIAISIAMVLFGAVSFGRSNPLEKDGIFFSNDSFKTIRFHKNRKVEVEFSGTSPNENELYLDEIPIPLSAEKFKVKILVNSLREQYTLKVINPGVSEAEYPFKIKLLKELPPSLQIRIRAGNSKSVMKEQIFTGTFPAKDWVRFTWLKDAFKTKKLGKQVAERKQKPIERQISAQAQKLKSFKKVRW